MSQTPDWHHLPVNPYNQHTLIVGHPQIGVNVWIGPFSVIDGSGGLTIGDGCHISAGVQIYTHSTVQRATSSGRAEIERSATSIGAFSHVGAGAIVLMGCSIGPNSVIGAGAVVLENTKAPDHSLLVGNPARIQPRRRH